MQVYEYCLVWHVYTVPILGLCIYIYKASEGYSDKKKHSFIYIYILCFVFKLELSILL